MGNNWPQSLMFMYDHMNILDNINLADVSHDLVGRKDSRKQIFRNFFSKLFIVYVGSSFLTFLVGFLGTFYIFIFPIKCM